MSLVPGRSQYNVEHGIPCRNHQCKSYGRAHYNCLCTSSGPQTGRSGGSGPSMASAATRAAYAEGGEVHFCDSNIPHLPDCEHFADGAMVEQNNEFINNPALAVDHHLSHHGLSHSLTSAGYTKSEDPNRIPEEFMDSHKRGRAALKSHSTNFIGKDKLEVNHDKDKREALKSYVTDASANPMKMIEAGGNLGQHFPDHAGIVAAKASTAVSYLDSIKPKPQQAAPLDPIIQPSKFQKSQYDRQVDIAENPFIVYRHTKNGTLQPQDVVTIQTIYPNLHKKMLVHAMDALVNKQMNGEKIPYPQQQSLSLLLGEPLDYTLTQGAMASIMMANAGAQVQSQGMPGKPKGGATAATQKTLERTDKLYEDKLDRLSMRD